MSEQWSSSETSGLEGSTAASSSSTTDAAKAEAGQVAQTSKESASQVAGTAKEQGQQVLAEASSQARNLVGETKTQLSQQAGAQQQRAAGTLRSVGSDLSGMASSGDQNGVAAQLVRQAADRVQAVADWLENRDPSSLLDDVRDFARRKPGSFLLGSAIAGLLAGRATRAGVDLKRESSSDTSGRHLETYATDYRTDTYPTGYTDVPPAAPTGYPYDAPDVGGTTGETYAGTGEYATGQYTEGYAAGTVDDTYPAETTTVSGTTDDLWTDPGEQRR